MEIRKRKGYGLMLCSFSWGDDTIYIGVPERPALPHRGHMRQTACSLAGSSNVNVEPPPSFELTQIRPPIRSTSSRQM
jgi:hypothetical protein